MIIDTYPLLRGLNELTSGALTVPQTGSSEASVRDAREGRSSCEQVGVGTHEDVGHHGARAGARREDASRIDTIRLDGVANHGGNGLRIASGVVRERRGSVDIPTSSRVGCVGVDDYEAVGVCEVRVLGALEVRLSGTLAVVHGDDERWRAGKARWLVQEHLHACRVGPEVRDLLELPSCGERANSRGNHCQER